MALCYLKDNQFKECVRHASWVLSADRNNVKALFRRGVALSKIGLDLEGSLKDLRTANKMEPKNAEIARNILQVKEKISHARTAEKKAFGGVLSTKAVSTEDGLEANETAPTEVAKRLDSCDAEDKEALLGGQPTLMAKVKQEGFSRLIKQQKKDILKGLQSMTVDQQIAACFSVYDEDDDGFISSADLSAMVRLVASQRGLNITEPQVQDLVRRQLVRSDSNGDGKISFQDFSRTVVCLGFDA